MDHITLVLLVALIKLLHGNLGALYTTLHIKFQTHFDGAVAYARYTHSSCVLVGHCAEMKTVMFHT